VTRMQEEVQVFKLMKYREGYKDGAQGKYQDTFLRLEALVGIKVHRHPWSLTTLIL